MVYKKQGKLIKPFYFISKDIFSSNSDLLWLWKCQSKLNRPGKAVRFSIGSQASSPISKRSPLPIL